jgi:hypothetical protein
MIAYASVHDGEEDVATDDHKIAGGGRTPQMRLAVTGRQNISREVVNKEFRGCAAFSVRAQLTDQYSRSIVGLQGLGAASPQAVAT